jgi:hypothetical protein
MTTNQHPLTLRKRDKWRLEGSIVSVPEALYQTAVLALEERLRKTRTESKPEIQHFCCSTNPAGKIVKKLETKTGPSPFSKPNRAQIATPEVKRRYIPSEMPEVSPVRSVLIAWGKKLDDVRAAAT